MTQDVPHTRDSTWDFRGASARLRGNKKAWVEMEISEGWITKALFGRAWAGGEFYIDGEYLVWNPSRAQASIWDGVLRQVPDPEQYVVFRLPLGDVEAIEAQSKIGADAVSVTTAAGQFEMRCSGAAGVAAELNEARP